MADLLPAIRNYNDRLLEDLWFMPRAHCNESQSTELLLCTLLRAMLFPDHHAGVFALPNVNAKPWVADILMSGCTVEPKTSSSGAWVLRLLNESSITIITFDARVNPCFRVNDAALLSGTSRITDDHVSGSIGRATSPCADVNHPVLRNHIATCGAKNQMGYPDPY